MTTDKAFDRLKWRMTNGQFVPNENDLTALKTLGEWINREKQKEVQQNTIFAKMYVYCFIHELHFYKDLKFAQKKLHEVLKLSLVEQYQNFSTNLNQMEYEKFLHSIGITSDHPFLTAETQRKEEENIISENQVQIQRFLKGIWEPEKVFTSLDNQVSEAINHYKNLP